MIQTYHEYLKERKIMQNEQKIHESRYFKLVKDVHRHQSGRGARFQNHKITSYKIVSKYNRWAAAWSPPCKEVTALINADFYRDKEYSTWKFYNRRDAERAWVLLALKWS
jgi:hypothetical protein